MRTFSKKPNNATVGPAVSGYVSGVTEYIETDAAADSTVFDIDGAIGAAWESVGPTGSGATNIWTALDSVPTGAKWVEVKAVLTQNYSTTTVYGAELDSRPTGSAIANGYRMSIAQFRGSIASGAFVGNTKGTEKIRIDSTNSFDLYLTEIGTPTTNDHYLWLKGWGI